MKRLIKALGLAVLAIAFIGVGHSYAIIPYPIGDGGGGGAPNQYLSNRAPAGGSLLMNPPQQYCNGGIGYNHPCSDTLHGNKAPYFVVGNNQVLDPTGQKTFPHTRMNIQVYLQSGNTPVTVTIYNEAGNCNKSTIIRPSNSVAPDYNNISNGGPATKYSLQWAQGKVDNTPTFTTGTACTKTAYFTIANPNNAYWLNPNHSDVNGSGYTHYVVLNAITPLNSDTNLQGENSFYVVVSGNNRAGFAAGQVGYGYRDTNICDFVDNTGGCNSSNNGNVYTQSIVFGVDKYCGDDLNAFEPGNVKFSDIDAAGTLGKNWNPHIHVWLQKENWNNLFITSGNSGKDPNPNWQDVKELTSSDLQSMSKASQNYQIGPNSFDPGYRYRLLLQNVGMVNTVYVTFNGNLSQVSGVYHLRPGDCAGGMISCQANIIDKNTVHVTLTNNAPYNVGKNFQLRQKPDTSYKGVPQTWTLASDILANGGSKISSAKGLFNRPDNAGESYELYDDTGYGPIDFSNGNCYVTPPPPVTPQVSPYFQAWQNDASAGGGFKTTDIDCPGDYPAYVSPTTTQTSDSLHYQYRGGIIANSIKDSPYQSKSDFGAAALGYIPTPPVNDKVGFFAITGGGGLRAWFANLNNPSGEQGYLNSSNSNHCVKDFYTDTQINPTLTTDLQNDIYNNCPVSSNGANRCQFKMNGPQTISELHIPVGTQVTVYVSGTVTIDGNIYYSDTSGDLGAENITFDASNSAEVPYFALITQGYVYVTNNVTELDGLYVVQPTPSAGNITLGSGVFATCDTSKLCNKQLVVNGAVIAQHVELLRTHGASEDLGDDPNTIGQNPAEIFNFVPSMVLGVPMFKSNCLEGACNQGTYSVAPVF